MKKVILSVTNNLETDQRINKVATSLKKMGFVVSVVGSNNRPCSDYHPGYEANRISVKFKKGFLFYAEFNLRLFCYLLRNSFDVYVANDTDTLLPTYIVSLIKKKPLVVDLHELFPELPEVTDRKLIKWVWTKIEDFILPRVKHCYTVCQSISDYYKTKYGIEVKVVRNLPNYKAYSGKKKEFSEYGDKSIILYQGAVNEGRGIEWLMDAMTYVDNAVFVVIGTGDLYKTLSKRAEEAPYKGKVVFLGHKPYSQLIDYTLSADLGVCLLKNQGLSYYYALPNRVFDYMQSHIPILATEFPEIARIVNTEKTGITINTEDALVIASAINRILKESVDHQNFNRAAQIYNWENEEKVLKEVYSRL